MSHNKRLVEIIREAVRRRGRPGWSETEGAGRTAVSGIPFRDYMNLCLYDETEGYYRTGDVRIGREGDFYTSSAVGSVMGDMLASYIAGLAAERGLDKVMEWGAGTGRLSIQLLKAWRLRHPRFAAAATLGLVDGNPVHRLAADRALAEAGLAEAAACLAPEEAERQLETDGPWIVFANELLDAFPVHRVTRRDGRLWELGAAEGEDGGFRWCCLPLEGETGEALVQALAEDGTALAEGQETEIGLDGIGWLRRLLARMRTGVVILVDYGDTAQELTAVHRMRGTLLGYHRHAAHDDPFRHIGEQDLTAHVNFSACARAAERAGWRTVFYGTQKAFLMACGVLAELRDHWDPDPFSETARRNRAVRQLLLSDGMSEGFKVAVYERGPSSAG